jgi:hypothetical protein
MPPVGFETKTPAGERPQTHALDRAGTGIGISFTLAKFNYKQTMEQSSSWEANRYSDTRAIPLILWNPTVQNRINKSLLPAHTLSLHNPGTQTFEMTARFLENVCSSS